MKTNYISDLAIHPGEYLKEVLDDINMTQLELSQRLNRPKQVINEIIKGKKSITPETAIELESVLGIPSHIWLGLESEYQLIMAKQKELLHIKEDVKLVKKFPYMDLSKNGFVKKTRNNIEKVFELKRFFSVTRLSSIESILVYQPAFRVAKNHKNISDLAIASWMQASLLKARDINTMPFDKNKLEDNLEIIKGIMVSKKIDIAIKHITEILSSCGIAFVLLPTFEKTKIHGTTFWIDNKAVLAMSSRYSYSDIFWFSFFHEIGHILLHDKRVVFLENNGDDTKQEQEADSFASDFLIPPSEYEILKKENDFSIDKIKRFAKKINTLPSIIVGRLMHDAIIKYNDYRLSKLREKYQLFDN